MKILLLPGASNSNKEWTDIWSSSLSDKGHEVKKFYYDHWGKEEMFSFEKEAEKLSHLDLNWRHGIVVIAKSIGTLLCVYAVDKNIIKPAHSVFMGFPSDIQGEKDANIVIDIESWISDYDVPTDVFQNELDPVTSYEHVDKFLKGKKSINTVSIPGDTHKYLPDVYMAKIIPLLV